MPVKRNRQEQGPRLTRRSGVTQSIDRSDEPNPTPSPSSLRGRKRKGDLKQETGDVEIERDSSKPAKISTKGPPRKRIKCEVDEEIADGPEKAKIQRKRKTKEEKEAEAMPLAARTVGHQLYIGAHVSSAGGVHNATVNSVNIGANAFALFLKSQRKWVNPPLSDDHCKAFHSNCQHHAYDQARYVVPHGSYLVNLAHLDATRTAQAYESFCDDLKRCERLGISLYNFHPGNTVGNNRAAAVAHLASNINRAHADTSTVITLLENMAAGGNVLGSTFEDLRDIIALVVNKQRVGVCLDTCHAFAYGYDLRTPAAFQNTMSEFDRIVGIQYLKAVHLNDSKAPFASRRDLHANIGTGFLGLRAFHNLVNDSRFAGIPLVLETPIEVRDDNGVLTKDEKGKEKEDKGIWANEIKMLEGLVGMNTEGEEFSKLEKQLARKGEPERKRLMEQQERKQEKDRLKASKSKKSSSAKKVKVKVKHEAGSETELSSLCDTSDEEKT